ncbi:MAG: DUF1573 domain-containing protein [Rikenellaceae bacterium]
MRYITLILGLLSSVSVVFGAGLKFYERSWDFGNIAESEGVVRHTFSLTNRSSKPVVILSIRSSCGCTTSEYSREPIAAGATTQIEVLFDPRYREGYFSKDIEIFNTATKEPEVLTVSGFIEQKELTIEEAYPFILGGGVRIERCYATLWGAEGGELVQSSLAFVNTSQEAIEITFEPLTHREELRLYYDSGVGAGERTTLGIGYYIEREIEEAETGLRDTLKIQINGEPSKMRIYLQAPFEK